MLVVSIPLAKSIKPSANWSTKKQITTSSIIIIICMSSLAVLCIAEGVTGQKVPYTMREFAPLPIFATLTFFHVAGITRNLWIMIQQIFSSFPLDLHLRVICTALTWLTIFAITKILPKLLYLVGVGYFYAYSVIFMIVSLVFLQKSVPDSLSVDDSKAWHDSHTLSISSCESNTRSMNSSCNEINEI